MQDLKAIHILVKGRVQGVGFRYFIKNEAEKLKLNGQVKNLADGSVEIKALGTQDVLDEFLKRSKSGSRLAKVTSVEVRELMQEEKNRLRKLGDFIIAY